MIKNVVLKNWKAFEELDLDLPSGTSFIVARNGIGKTSLLQALHFGLFGDRQILASGTSVERAVRGGPGATASVTLTVDLDTASWIISREVSGSLTSRDPLPGAKVTRNGQQASDSEWQLALAEAAGVGLTELRLLAAIGEGATISSADARNNGQYNLIHHLSDVLGVSRLRDHALVLRRSAKDISSAADNERLTLRDRPQRSNAGEQERLTVEQSELRRRVEDLREQLGQVEARRNVRSTWAAFRTQEITASGDAMTRLEVVRSQFAERRTLLEDVLGAQFEGFRSRANSTTEPASTIISVLQNETREIVAQLRSRRDSEVHSAGSIDAQISAIDSALDLLASSSAVCPTCRQPLSSDAAERARTAHQQERDSLMADRERVRTRSVQLSEAIDILANVLDIRLPMEPVSPPGSPPEDDDGPDELTESTIREELRSMTRRLQEIDASLRMLAEDAEQRAADAALSRRLVAQYRQADLSTIGADTFERMADSICQERINPLAEMLGKRWSELWPGRPGLSLDFDTGDVIGHVADTQISLGDLSGGERAVAVILLRLLALQSASNSPVLLMDEPLEHLDPRNRRLLAGLLVAATRGQPETPPRQLLVTTYEESVTRRLDNQMAGEGSHVVYVTTDGNVTQGTN